MPLPSKAPFPKADVLLRESEQILAPFKRLFPKARLNLSPPPFSSKEHFRSLGGSLNEAILRGEPFFNPELSLLVVPLVMDGKVAGLVTVEHAQEEPDAKMSSALLEVGRLALERVALLSLYFDPPGSGLYRPGPFRDHINRAMTLKGWGSYLGRGSLKGFALVAAGPVEVSQAAHAVDLLPPGGMARVKGPTLLAMLPDFQVEDAVEWLQALSDGLGRAGFAAGVALYPTDLLAEADAGGSSGPGAGDIVRRAQFALKSAQARGPGVYLTFEQASEIIPGAPGRPRFLSEVEGLIPEPGRFAVLMARVEELRDDLGALDHGGIEEVLSGYGDLAKRLFPGALAVAPWSWDTLGIFLEGLDEPGAVDSAARLRDGAEEEFGAKVTVGAAVYPFHDFGPEDVLKNAMKALTHAGFFGPGAIQPFDAVSLNIAGDRLLAVGDEDGAMGLFGQALALNPEEVNVLNSLGVLWGRRGDYEKAKSFFARAQAACADDFMAAYNLGSVNLALGERDDALQGFLKASNIDPARGEALLMAGRLLVEAGRFGEGADLLRKAWDAGLREHVVDRFLGEALVEAGDAAEGRFHLMRALRENPDDPGGLKILARSYIEDEKELALARSLLERGMELAPDDGEIPGLMEKTRGPKNDRAINSREREE